MAFCAISLAAAGKAGKLLSCSDKPSSLVRPEGTAMTDEELIAAYYACDDAAMDELYRRYYARLVVFFHRSGLSQQPAEDQMHDVFVRVMETKKPPKGRSPRRYDPTTGVSFRAWLFRIALNLLRDTWRKSERRDISNQPPEAAEGQGIGFETTIAGKELPPGDLVLAKERRVQVHECLAALPERERVTLSLWLELQGEVTLARFAETLDVSVPTAWRVLQRALRLMRASLETKGVTGRDLS
jgi:RNA polymerase sigma-70 factor (ECF subfamily)